MPCFHELFPSVLQLHPGVLVPTHCEYLDMLTHWEKVIDGVEDVQTVGQAPEVEDPASSVHSPSKPRPSLHLHIGISGH